MNSIIISVAPMPKKSAGIAYDYSPSHVAREVIQCWRQGASMAHLHVLDEQGNETSDITAFNETLHLIRQESDIIIQGSTGGSSQIPLSDRCVSIRNSRVQTASLNMGSVNIGNSFFNYPYPDIQGFAALIKEQGIQAEMQIFDLSMLYVAMRFAKNGWAPPHFNLCFGFENAMPAQKTVLPFLLSELQDIENPLVGVLETGRSNSSLFQYALEFPITILRVGFEDSMLGMDGQRVESNETLVLQLARLIRASGRGIAPVTEAKVKMEING